MNIVRRWLARFDLRTVAIGFLAVWAAGLIVATVQLELWQNQLTRTLVQLSADAQFRARVANQRDQVDPEWYRRKALSLLAAMEKIRQNTRWMLFVPGSWRRFDDLEERLSARLEREFGEIVLETIRRELFLRTSKITGVPLQKGGGAFRFPLECTAPQPGTGQQRGMSITADDLPETTAVRNWLGALGPLDGAVRAWMALQSPGQADPEHLRRLVRYTLDAELPGEASRSLALFASAADEANAQPGVTLGAMQAAARCTLGKGMAAVHQRLLVNNDLLALEQALLQQSAGLFDARRAPPPFPAAAERYRAVHALLADQQAVLAQGRNAWMRSGELGGGYEQLLGQVNELQLLGPQAVQEVRAQAQAEFAKFRQRFASLYGGKGEPPGIVWEGDRFVLAPDRLALQEALGALLQEPYMQGKDDASGVPANARFDDALAWAEVRRRFWREHAPRFPEFARTSVGRVVDARLAQLSYDTAVVALRTALPQDPAAPLDAATLKQHRERVGQVQAQLVAMRAAHLSQALAAQHGSELLRRLSVGWEQVRAMPFFAPPAAQYGWWQGEPGPVLRALGAADPGVLHNQLQANFNRIDAIGRQAELYLSMLDPALASEPAAQRWRTLNRELERWRARLPDSSMVAAERYLLTLGPTLRRENCFESLAYQTPPRHQDEVAVRLAQVHNALVQRCLQLRGGG